MKGTDIIFWTWIASGFSFVIATLVPREYWFMIWMCSIIIPTLVWQIYLIIKECSSKSRKVSK